MIFFFSKHRIWLLPLLAVLLITPFTPWLDLEIARYFYKGKGEFSNNPVYTFMFTYGVLPGQLLFILAGLTLVGSYFFKKFRQWRAPALSVVLCLAIGPGLVVHAILKDHWGRPRPKQVIEFGGHQPFRPYYQPNFFHQPEPSKSFPCGHCTMGFYFFSLAFIGLRRRHLSLFWISIAFAIASGLFLSLMRMAQGGHFLSDTLISALIMWIVAYLCDKWTTLYIEEDR